MDIEALRAVVERGFVYVTDHADEEANNDSLSLRGIYESLRNGRIIEDYPADRPYPSCLVLGYCQSGMQAEPVHSVWAYNQGSGFCVLVTVYRPDPARWYEDYETRRR